MRNTKFLPPTFPIELCPAPVQPGAEPCGFCCRLWLFENMWEKTRETCAGPSSIGPKGRGEYLASRGTGNHVCLDSLLSLSSVCAFHSCTSCALRQQLQAPVRLLHSFRRPSFGTFSLQFFSQDSENFEGFWCQNCFDQIGNMLHLFQPTIGSSAWQCVVVCLSYYTKLSLSLSLPLSRACESCDLLMDLNIDVF